MTLSERLDDSRMTNGLGSTNSATGKRNRRRQRRVRENATPTRPPLKPDGGPDGDRAAAQVSSSCEATPRSVTEVAFLLGGEMSDSEVLSQLHGQLERSRALLAATRRQLSELRRATDRQWIERETVSWRIGRARRHIGRLDLRSLNFSEQELQDMAIFVDENQSIGGLLHEVNPILLANLSQYRNGSGQPT